jgi:hypothetical protein
MSTDMAGEVVGSYGHICIDDNSALKFGIARLTAAQAAEAVKWGWAIVSRDEATGTVNVARSQDDAMAIRQALKIAKETAR